MNRMKSAAFTASHSMTALAAWNASRLQLDGPDAGIADWLLNVVLPMLVPMVSEFLRVWFGGVATVALLDEPKLDMSPEPNTAARLRRGAQLIDQVIAWVKA